MTRIVVYAHRPKRPAKKNAKATPATKQTQSIVVATSEKRLRAERRLAEPREPSPEVDAFFARNARPGGALPPPRKR